MTADTLKSRNDDPARQAVADAVLRQDHGLQW
jgi:hypothetical protein